MSSPILPGNRGFLQPFYNIIKLETYNTRILELNSIYIPRCIREVLRVGRLRAGVHRDIVCSLTLAQSCRWLSAGKLAVAAFTYVYYSHLSPERGFFSSAKATLLLSGNVLRMHDP